MQAIKFSIDVGLEMQIAVGTKLSGKYMGFDFTGTVDVIHDNNPSYHKGKETTSVWIKLDAPMFGEYGLMKYDTGNCIGMSCRRTPSGLKRSDKRYTELKEYFVG